MSEEEYGSSSEEDDDDYVPDEDELSEDDDTKGETENAVDKQNKKQKKLKSHKRRKGGIKLNEDDEEDSEEEDENELDKEQDTLRKQKEEEKSKAKMDDLWASFKKETAAVRPKTTTKTVGKVSTQMGPSSSKVTNLTSSASKFVPSAQKKVTITKTFDFAGEEVKVTKTVDADSEEAKKAFKKEEKEADKPQPGSSIGVKRAGGLGSILGNLGKKPKISTLEKSKLDWETFKEETGISDELQHHNKDGYLEKQAFLTRTDWNSFEREKAMRNLLRKST